MTDRKQAEAAGSTLPLDRRTVLKTTGLAAALSLATGGVAASEHQDGAGSGQGDGPPESTPAAIDPLFGAVSAGPNPCGGDASEDCLEAFGEPRRPAHEVEVQIDLPDVFLLLATQDVLSDEQIERINSAAADGTVEDGETLEDPDAEVELTRPGGETLTVTVGEIARSVADTDGFYYHPAGLTVNPGDVVLFSAETPDHGVAAYHERHGRQNRMPDDVGPIASPLIPVGGYWLYRFETEGVYDFYCPPHQIFGMVVRVVVSEEDDVPELSVEQTGRPPESENLFPDVFAGLDPNLPSSMAALETDALAPGSIVENGPVPWEDVVAEHRENTSVEGSQEDGTESQEDGPENA